MPNKSKICASCASDTKEKKRKYDASCVSDAKRKSKNNTTYRERHTHERQGETHARKTRREKTELLV
jgi:hypothetical protein